MCWNVLPIVILRVTNYEKCTVILFFAVVADESEVEKTCQCPRSSRVRVETDFYRILYYYCYYIIFYDMHIRRQIAGILLVGNAVQSTY